MNSNSISKCIILLCLNLLFLNVSGQGELTQEEYQQAESMLRFNTTAFVDRMNVNPNWLDDGRFWYRILTSEAEEYVLYDPKNKKRMVAPSKEELLQGIDIKETPGYDRRRENLSPDGKKVLFIKDWNLWLRNIDDGKERQLTYDGIENFGYATDNAGWRQSERPIVLWSPDSKKIATFQQDQRHVSEMYLVSTNVGAPVLKKWKYPLPEDDDIIRIHRVVINVESGEVIRLNMPPDPRRGTLCDDISCTGKFDDNQWSRDGKKLIFVSSSRDHKRAKLRVADVETGDIKDIFEETVETQYESGQGAINWHYLEDSREVIWYSERDNWGHLYLYDFESGKLKHQITKGEFVVTRLKHVDEKNRKLYFEANGREEDIDPYFSHFYSIGINGNNLKLLTPEIGNHRISISSENKYFVDNYSQPDVPPVSVLRQMDGTKISTLEKADISRLLAKGWQPPKQVKVRSFDDDYDLYGLMFTPTHLDKSKKYPIVNYIYPGPQGGSVGSRSFSPARGDHQALAELGFIVIAIEGTCNPNRSKAFHDKCYGKMGTNTLPDQVYGMQQLAEQYPFIDLDRVGIWGHSGGGFATASAMFKYPDFFDVGVAQSGNHDNRNYEDDWGERYIGLLEKDEDGKDNYEHQANQVYAENLKGKLLLAHGGMDDNVPPYNTTLVVDALIKANKDFDLIMFPNARHGYGADTYYMTRRRWDYFVKNLLGKTPPKEYKIIPKSDPRINRA